MEWLDRLARIRWRTRGGERDPDKALLLLLALGRLWRSRGRETALRFGEIEGPLGVLLAEFGPPKPVRPEYPFHHLAGDGVWEAATATGTASPGPDARALRALDAAGRLEPRFAAALLADPDLFDGAVRLLLAANFDPAVHDDLCAAVGLPVTRVPGAAPDPMLRQRVLVAYGCRCAFCGYEGWIGDSVVGLEAARLRWQAFDGRDDLGNALCLCALHHRLLAKGVLGLTPGGAILVSRHFVGSSDSARHLVLSLAGRPTARPEAGLPAPDHRNVDWHARQVFRGPARIG